MLPLTRKLLSWLLVPATTLARLKPVLSWLAVTLGCFVGLVACAEFGVGGVSLSDRSPAWYLPWFGTIGEALLGVGFLVGSFVALRNRRLAGIIFLAVMPIVAFCLAYPASGFLVWRGDGGWFESPFPATAIGLAAVFYAPFLTLLWMRRRRRSAVIVFVLAASVAGVTFAYSHWTAALLPRLVGWSVPFLLPGLFWLRTGKLGWPSLLRTRPSSLAKRVLALAATCVAIFFLDVVFTVMLCGVGSNLFSPNCKGRPLFVHPLFPTQAVFTAKVFFAARSVDALLGLHGGLRPSGPDRRVGDWAIGIVQERFWGMPHWTRLVLLTNSVYWEGETYFVDGHRFSGLLTQFLPIIGDIACSRTKLVQNAIVDLRLLRKPPPTGSLRITGCVRGPEKLAFGWTRPPKPNFLAGARISVTGPAGSSIIKTDSAGVYELDDLAFGDYTLQLLTPENQLVGFFDSDASTAKLHLDHNGIVEKNFELFWNGRIEGQVKNDAGKPAHAWVELLSADGSQIPGNVNFFQMAIKDGSYQFRKIPPGRYMVVVDPSGPYDEWPYDLQYYPGGVHKDKARVFELGAGQRVTGIDFRVPLLAERETDVRVTWANGTVAAGAPVCVAYENAADYDSLAGTNCFKNTDQNGLAVIHTYGRSQVRVFAEQYEWPDRFRSQPVQSAADQTQNTMNLVLTSAKR